MGKVIFFVVVSNRDFTGIVVWDAYITFFDMLNLIYL